MLFKGKLLIEVEIEASTLRNAKQILNNDMNLTGMYGVKKTVLVEPNLEPVEHIEVVEI